MGLDFVLFTLLTCCALHGQPSLEEIFRHPPPEARPRGYWVWAHGNFDYSRIREELREFKEMGLGGVDVFDLGIRDPYEIIPPGNPFMGERMLDGFAFAVKEAGKLDLSMGLSVANGWNAGGDWTTPDEMIMRLLLWKDTVRGPVTLNEIGFPDVPVTFEKPYGTFDLYPRFNENGFPVFYENVALMAVPLNQNQTISSIEEVIHFDPGSISENQVVITIPEGTFILVRAVVTPLGQKMWMRSDRSDGFIMDHYSRKATRHHFEHIISRLEERLGPSGETSLERLYLASFEAEDYIIWSPGIKEEFQNINGYSMDPYLPALAGFIIGNKELTERFLFDYRHTISEMFVNNHYRQAREICHQHDLLLASESGGPGLPLHYVPTEDLKALGSVDIMRGEFWNKESEYFDEHGNDLLQVVRNISSAAHIYGRKIVEMEAFTSHRKHWQERPLELKKLADRAFCEGMTRVVYHTMPHSPGEAGLPGWSYSAGTHISPKMTWWELSKPFHQYLARTSALLQQGLFVADVAYYYGEQVPKFASGTKYIRKTLGRGYDYDDLNKEVLLQSSVTDDGRLLLPSGMTYRLLVLTDSSMMSLEVAEKIEELVNRGARVLGNRPSTVPGLFNYREREIKLNDIADRLWVSQGMRGRNELGKGTVYSGYTEKQILEELGVAPDFTCREPGQGRLDYIHRATEMADIYFIRNQDSIPVRVLADFRVKDRNAYFFHPETGAITRPSGSDQQEHHTRVPIQLAPLGSVFVVFSDGELDGIPIKQDIAETRVVAILDDPWDVRFEHGWGFEPVQQFSELIDWTNHPDPELAAYSGIATYYTSFNHSGTGNNSEHHLYLDLGEVRDVARVYLNGHEIASLVFPPFCIEVNQYLRQGQNHLAVEVANTWLNRLVHESSLAVDEQKTRSNVGGGDRDNPVRIWRDYEPQPSGLIGPVTIKELK